MKKNAYIFLLVTGLWILSAPLPAAEKPLVNRDNAGIAIKGTDPVAYFLQGEPVKGEADLAFQWLEATWLFSSQENLDLFTENPEKYAPQYGGYCAYAMASGNFVDIIPEAWKIFDGKLYLNFSLKVQRK